MTTSIKFRALTDEDHKLFFEALGEHGKDFQNIQQYMAHRGGQRSNNTSNGSGNSVSNGINNRADGSRPSEQQEKKEQDKKEDDRKREQIRNFYNKLYAKLSELIGRIDDRVEKINQELYLLINYGEIWKRNGFKFNSKTKRLLEELVYQGTTTFRFEKKNVRLRTPTCKALKKINEIGVDEKVKVVTTKELPKDVIVEFHPATNRDWLKVQSISQNPRLRARLSIQKRLSSILDYLENKWNMSQEKINHTVDIWLKLTINNSQSSDNNANNLVDQSNKSNNSYLNQDAYGSNVISQRIRLKPSNHHELKEVNITRVVPDNHLDLSLNAYIKRLESSQPKDSERPICKQTQSSRDLNLAFQSKQDANMPGENCEYLSVTNTSRLPISLTTPDCSILLERSCTSDQPSIAQARKHLNILQSLTGTLEGCENSRTAYEDTQDRSLMSALMNQNTRSVSFAPIEPNMGLDSAQLKTGPTIAINNDISALYDEDAALPAQPTVHDQLASDTLKDTTHNSSMPCSDSQNSVGGDETANDAFPTVLDKIGEESGQKEIDLEEQFPEMQIKDSCGLTNCQPKLQNHMIEIEKFAAGWTREDEPSITLGELYLAFKCPDKIILEYQFESSDNLKQEHGVGEYPVLTGVSDNETNSNIKTSEENSTDDILIFKLLTAASLSLARIERQKIEQHKLREPQQTCPKLKRRKGPIHGQTMTRHDIEATNQRVEEALKQLQPTRLSSFRRAR